VRDEGRVKTPEVDGTRLRVRAKPDGPLELTGPFAIASADGKTMLSGTSVTLCRCGRSAAKPFCDGSHERTGFRSG
jgi:CDGSH-type Zn-finger protein